MFSIYFTKNFKGDKGDRGDRGLTTTIKGDEFPTGIIEGPPGPPGPPGRFTIYNNTNMFLNKNKQKQLIKA